MRSFSIPPPSSPFGPAALRRNRRPARVAGAPWSMVGACLFWVASSLAGCASAPVKPTGEGVNVSLRRVDVVSANFDQMTVDLILAVENTTGSPVAVSADASLALIGEANEADAAEPEGEAATDDAATGEGAAGSGALDDGAEAAGGTGPVDGVRHTGSGSGTAPAQNTSELPVRINVPLPADAALLERILDWRKARVQVDANVRIGLETRPIGGKLELVPPRLPEVRLKGAQVASADGGAAGTGFFTVVVENRNHFQVTLSRLAWTVTIKDKELEPSSSSGPTEVMNDPIEANQVGEYQAEVQIDEKAFGKELKSILKSRSVPYVVQGTMEVRGIVRPFRFTGEMKFPR